MRSAGRALALVATGFLAAAPSGAGELRARHAEQYMGPDYQERALPKQGEELVLRSEP